MGLASASLAAAALAQPADGAPGHRAYLAVARDDDSARVASLLRDAVRAAGGACGRVERYQRFREAPNARTLKVECAGQATYLLSLGADGATVLDGGDGRIRPADPADGAVVEAPDSVADEAPLPPVDPALLSSNDAGGGWLAWLFLPIGLLLAVAVGGIARSLIFPAPIPPKRYTSDDKTRMVAEARELAPNLWLHPTGVFIARGRRGKRRIFPTLVCANAYRRLGLKLKELR